MSIFKNTDLLEIIEEYASDNGGYSNEEELSKAFDEQIAPLVIQQHSEDDTIAMNEAFNNWTDGLCKDGEIHDEQYDKYCYVGKYSD